jgi:signal transduction histidine kinase
VQKWCSFTLIVYTKAKITCKFFTNRWVFAYGRTMPFDSNPSTALAGSRAAFRVAAALGLGLFALASIASVLLYLIARNSLFSAARHEVVQLAEIAAVQVNAKAHAQIRRAEQAGTPLHLQTLAPLVQFHKATKDAMYVYTAILQNGEVYFVLGTDYLYRRPGDTLPIDPIMYRYEGNDQDVRVALAEQHATSNKVLQKETFRSYLSAYAPFWDGKKFEGVVGVDIDAAALERRLAKLNFGLAMVLLLSFFAALAVAFGVRVSRLRALQNQRLRQDLEHSRDTAERSANIAALAAVVAHEFSQHLTVASGHIDLSQILNGSERAIELEFAQDAIARAGDAVEQMRALGGSAWSTTRAHRVDLLICEAVERLERRGIGTTRFDVAVTPITRYVQVDALRAQAALGHLLRNAAQAEATGRVSVVVLNAVELSAWPDIFPCSDLAGCVAIVITDSGHSIKPETIAAFGQPFFTTKGAGHGLGFTVVKSVINAFGGGLKYQLSASGSRFALLLPRADQDMLHRQVVTAI